MLSHAAMRELADSDDSVGYGQRGHIAKAEIHSARVNRYLTGGRVICDNNCDNLKIVKDIGNEKYHSAFNVSFGDSCGG